MIKTYEKTGLNELTSDSEMLDALESGALIYFPRFAFDLLESEKPLLKEQNAYPLQGKNISYHCKTEILKAVDKTSDIYVPLKNMMHRYADFSHAILNKLFPHYEPSLIRARTSFRPVEIAGRKAPSYRKDDKLLHVDSFPGTPCQGKRLLRVFSNVNPDGKDRVWRIGDDFGAVVQHFKSQLKRPPAFYKHVLERLKITRGLRTDYDALMLQLHNAMKSDSAYQQNVKQETIHLASGGLWIVYTDQVSHAAMEGQFCLEQTFLLPVNGMKDPKKSPLSVLEGEWKRVLV